MEQPDTQEMVMLPDALEHAQEALAEVRGHANDFEPTTALATADAHLVEAIAAITEAHTEEHEDLSPEQKRIRELEAMLAEQRAQLQDQPPLEPSVPEKHLARNAAGHAGRPRGIMQFEKGHNPPDPSEPDFQSSVAPPPGLHDPGQGKGRIAQAQITGEGPAAGEALEREAAIQAGDDRAAIREAHGLPPSRGS